MLLIPRSQDPKIQRGQRKSNNTLRSVLVLVNMYIQSPSSSPAKKSVCYGGSQAQKHWAESSGLVTTPEKTKMCIYSQYFKYSRKHKVGRKGGAPDDTHGDLL